MPSFDISNKISLIWNKNVEMQKNSDFKKDIWMTGLRSILCLNMQGILFVLTDTSFSNTIDINGAVGL